MANLKQIRTHIASVQSTGKITKAMNMVATSKLKKAKEAVIATRPYVNELISVIEHLVVKTDVMRHPLLRNPDEKKNIVLIVISGDKGLCGAYNHNIVKRAQKFVDDNLASHEKIYLIFVGKKAYDAMRKLEDPKIEKHLMENAWGKSVTELGLAISKQLCEQFETGEIDEAFVLYTVFKSAIAQSVVLDAVLPIQSILTNCDADGNSLLTEDEKNELDDTSYIYEPSNREILDLLLPRAVSIHVQRSLLESLASENGARMTAMDSASKNATEMIGKLTLQYNRARQAAITNELIEVVSGAEAL